MLGPDEQIDSPCAFRVSSREKLGHDTGAGAVRAVQRSSLLYGQPSIAQGGGTQQIEQVRAGGGVAEGAGALGGPGPPALYADCSADSG